jgi:hypothetical protein
MPEIVSDGDIVQTPIEAANEAYSLRTDPGTSAFFRSTLQEGPSAFLGRAAERGTVAGSSSFDQGMAGVVAQSGAADQPLLFTPAPIQSPEIPPEQYNDLYAPRDRNGKIVPIGDQPMPEALAQIIGQQKTEAMTRESVLARYSAATTPVEEITDGRLIIRHPATHGWLSTFAIGAAASMLDPLNAGSLFSPGLGETVQ